MAVPAPRTSVGATRTPGRAGNRLGPFALVAAGALVLIGVAGWSLMAARLARPGAVAVPVTIAGLPLTQQSVGAEAVAEVTRLHGKEFPLTSGAMAVYEGGEVMLWVSGTPLRWTAGEMVQAMTEKIAEGRSPFTPVGTQAVGGRTVYELAGLGQRHFYFQSGSLVIWLAASDNIAETALTETLAFYP